MMNKRTHHLLLVASCLLLPLVSDGRIFTDDKGRTVEAEIVDRSATDVTIQRADGKQFVLKISTLSAADQTFISQWQRPASAAPGAKPAASDPEAEQRKIMRVLEDVVVAKWDKQALTFRWNYLPQFTVTCPDAATKQFIETTFTQLCQDCGLKPGPAAALREFTVVVDTTEALRKLRLKETQINDLFQTGTYWYYDFADDHILRSVTAYVCSDKFTPEELKSRLLSLMVGGFGFPEVSRELEPADGSTLSYYWADVTALPEFDRKLLAFFYAHVPPGTKKSQIRTLFRKNWKP